MWWVDFLVFLVLSLVLSVSKKRKKKGLAIRLGKRMLDVVSYQL